MNRLELFRILRSHLKLSERRSPVWEQNKMGKAFLWFIASFAIFYLVFIAILLSMTVNDSDSITAYEFMYGIMPFILLIDFLLRFTFQQTPSQLVKPYSLLPISKYACIDCFLVNTLRSGFNLIWMAMFIPYAVMSVIFAEGIIATCGFLFGLWLLILVNSQWYLLARSLVNIHVSWWIAFIAVYGLLFSPAFIGGHANITTLCNLYAEMGVGFTFWHPLTYLLVLGFLFMLLAVNRRVQHRLVWAELGKTSAASVKASTVQFSVFNRWGELGEYLKLEVKSILRNKNLRKTFIFATLLVVFFSMILSFTDVYDAALMKDFWCIYCFAIYGAMLLTKIMCYEGNYIDALLIRQEKIVLLLRAKYLLYTSLILLPFLLMLPTVFTGKCSLLMLCAYAVFTAGLPYFLFFQMAVYNKQSMPLNTKFAGKGSMENNWLQVGVQFAVFVIPIILVTLSRSLFSDTHAYLLLLCIGLCFVLTSNYWIQNIYRRMMVRRYENLEAFRASRS